MQVCKVIIANSSQSFSAKLDYLTYGVPDNLQDKIHIGSFAVVPLGKQVVNAMVIDIDKNYIQDPKEKFAIKDIDDLISDQAIYQDELVELIKFTADYYACSFEDVLNAALPTGMIQKPEKEIRLSEVDIIEGQSIVLDALNKARGKKARFSRLKNLTKFEKKDLQKELNKLEKQGLVLVDYIIKAKKSKAANALDRLGEIDSKEMPVLTSEQEQVLAYINKQKTPQKYLIHGITGSGKTEVYLRLIAQTFADNKSSIVLVPEISLAPQVVERIAQRFGQENVLIWHSALSETERKHTWDELMTGEPKVVIGARSAVWAPIQNLGLIIIDEEHENSYKQESPNPRYHARTLAIKRAELNDCPIVFGSATPSVELYYKAKSKLASYCDYHLLEIKERVFKNPLPTVKVIDMREEFLSGNKSIFSRTLNRQITEALEKEEQIILFLNRRGSASHVFCRTCGYVYNCRNCESKMVYHESMKLMICHHCGYREAHPEACPECSMPTIKFFGLGTQKLEAEVKKIFPEAKIARLDSDTSKIKHNYLKIWQGFKDGKIDILIGTQMVAKGLDLSRVSTVGVISADSNFSQLDYQSEERGFQLLTQVAGRAGRGDQEGQAVFQSYQPERTVLQTAQEQDFIKFFDKEIENRRDLSYPPFSTLVRLVSASEDLAAAIETANKFHEEIYPIENIEILGPCPCSMPRLNNKHRQHLLIKIPRASDIKSQDDTKHQEAIKELKSRFKKFKSPKDTSLTIDINSISLY